MTLYGKWTRDPKPAPVPGPQEPDVATPAATKPAKKVPATGDATSGAFELLAMAGLVVAGTAVKVRK